MLTDESPTRDTLIAVSGGADSCALLLAFAAANRGRPGRGKGRIAAAHILHAHRPDEATLADAAFVGELAAALDVPLEVIDLRARPPGSESNAEARDRRRRYAALARLARRWRMPFVATAHHAGDQLETVLLGLIRGAGPAALGGVAERRALAEGVTLIRPMLGLSRADAERLCRDAGVRWREDATNADPARARAALRHGPAAGLLAMRPGAAERAARSARMLREAGRLIADAAARAFGGGPCWPRSLFREQPEVVAAEALRAALRRALGPGARGAGRIGARWLDSVVTAARGRGTDPRTFVGPRGLRVTITARRVRVDREQRPGK
ncbi:MAG: tRNA lysidine(34) synthetase TilS [Phycisphaerales bacterium]|nr:tRNA lysidine(34) synthetase TilS [Phycisphaerales bacterium]